MRARIIMTNEIHGNGSKQFCWFRLFGCVSRELLVMEMGTTTLSNYKSFVAHSCHQRRLDVVLNAIEAILQVPIMVANTRTRTIVTRNMLRSEKRSI